MIRVDKDTALTVKNIAICYNVWRSDYKRIKQNDDMYTNALKLALPFSKKLALTSAAATLGDGITLSAADTLDAKQTAAFEEVRELFKLQTVTNHDSKVITNMCKHGRTYEYVYMSADEVPVPKIARYTALCAFVVFDNTAEANSLFGCYVDSYKKGSNDWLRFTAFDDKAIYESEQQASTVYNYKADLSALDKTTSGGAMINLNLVGTHIFGRVPMTEIINNDEEQADFEQVIAAIKERTIIHAKNFSDLDNIAKNYLKARNVEIKGETREDKDRAQREMADSQRIGIKTDKGRSDPTDDISILSKNENYSSITEFGKDIDSKIYDLSMIPDLSSPEFAGNIAGVALKLKLAPFKELVKTKNGEIEKMYRRRIKMYVTALVAKDSTRYANFDAAQCNIIFNRSWTDNDIELAQIVAQLSTTGLFSDRYLTNKMPDADYDEEQSQLEVEREQKSKLAAQNPDPNNFSLEGFNGLFRGVNNANNTQ